MFELGSCYDLQMNKATRSFDCCSISSDKYKIRDTILEKMGIISLTTYAYLRNKIYFECNFSKN